MKESRVDGCESILGQVYNATEDSFILSLEIKEHLVTKRGILSIIAGIWDPLGFLAPIVVKARHILQQAMKRRLDWDVRLELQHEDLVNSWKSWVEDVKNWEGVKIRRCILPKYNDKLIKSTEFHIFCDGSEAAMSTNAFIRVIYESGEVHTSFVCGKVRVAFKCAPLWSSVKGFSRN